MSRTKTKKSDAITCYKDEAIVMPPGAVEYWVKLDDEEVEKLASGRCSNRVADRCWRMLEWKREASQDWASFTPRKKVQA